MRVLLTGGTGFFGTHLAEALLAAGHRLRALAHGDVRDEGSLAAAAQGIDAVLHAAGLVRAVRRRDLYAVNAEGTRALAEAAARAGASRLVLISSLAAGGPAAMAGGPPGSPCSHYARSKLLGEEAAFGLSGRIAVAVLRPPILYGPYDREVLALFRMAERGIVAVPALGDHRVHVLHAADAARAAIALLGAPGGGVYAVDDGAAHTWSELGAALGAATGRRVRIAGVPRPVLAAVAAVSTAVAFLSRQAPKMPWDGYRDLRERFWSVDNAALCRDTGWEPRITLAEGFAKTAEWYRGRGWLRP